MSRFLLTALGTNNNSTLCKYLKKSSDNFIVGADIYPKEYIPASNETDKFYSVSSIYEKNRYINEILSVCKNEKIEYLFPVIDEEVCFFAENISKFDDLGVNINCSNLESIKLCRNKLKTFEFIKENFPKIYTKTKLLDEFDGKFFPVFVKPSCGRASTGCIKIDNENELKFFINMNKNEDMIVQEFLEGEFYTVDFIRDDKNSQTLCLARQELVRNKNGCGTVVKTVKNDFLEKIVKDLADKINYRGIGNCEFILQNGKFHLIEINPRVSAGIDYSIRAGFDVISASVNLLNNECMKIKNDFIYDKIFVRRYETYEMQ